LLSGLWETYGQSGIYGVKAFMHFEEETQLTPDDILPPGPRAFIFLTRENLLEQATSFAIAKSHGGWLGHSDRDLPITQDEVDETRSLIEHQNAVWESWFITYGIEPLRITYEQQVDDPDGTVVRIEAHVLSPVR
jgi:LPS sulfotransferase NodH